MKLSGRIILNVLHFISVQENNVDVVFWVMASVQCDRQKTLGMNHRFPQPFSGNY